MYIDLTKKKYFLMNQQKLSLKKKYKNQLLDIIVEISKRVKKNLNTVQVFHFLLQYNTLIK